MLWVDIVEGCWRSRASSGSLGAFGVGILLLAFWAVPKLSGVSNEASLQDARQTAEEYADGWSRSDWDALTRFTYPPSDAIGIAHRQMVDGAGVSGFRVSVGQITLETPAGVPDDIPTATATLRVTATISGMDDLDYSTRLRLSLVSDSIDSDDRHWRVGWTPEMLHPSLRARRRFRREPSPGAEAVLGDLPGNPLTLSDPALVALEESVGVGSGPGGEQISIVDANGAIVETLASTPSPPAPVVRTTIDARVQDAALAAVGAEAGASLVARSAPSRTAAGATTHSPESMHPARHSRSSRRRR